MRSGIPRRRKLVLLTAGAAAVFAGAAASIAWFALRPQEVYRPGEAIRGLTADLARALPADHPTVTFTEAGREAGIAFRHFAGARTSQLPEDMGSGAAWGDYDNDGWLDLFVLNTAGPVTLDAAGVQRSPAHAMLFRNTGDGTLREVGAEAGVRFRGWGMGAAWADYDNDGWLDLAVSAYGDNVLYRNNGDGTFTDVSEDTGIGGRPGFWAGLTWSDYDRDGFVDLYVTGYVRYEDVGDQSLSRQYEVEQPAAINPSSFRPERNLLFRNRGNGTFEEVAERAGVSDPRGRGLGAAWADFDDDGWPDLYVANDVSDNVLFRNRGDGTFEDVSLAARVADYRGAMGLAVGDWDGDEDLDLFITHWIAQENALYSNLRSELRRAVGSDTTLPLQFMDEADRHGLGQIALDFVGWGTSFLDYDNDGQVDLFVANGSTLQQDDQKELLVPMTAQLFWNRGSRDGFYDVSPVAGPYFSELHVGRGAAFGDYDNDGDVDAFVVHNGGPGVLLRNDGGNERHWLDVELTGGPSNRSAFGARVRLVAGGRVQTQEVGSQSPYLSQNSLRQHFGLGSHETVDSLTIRWPSGARQTLVDLPADRVVRISEGATPTLSPEKRP